MTAKRKLMKHAKQENEEIYKENDKLNEETPQNDNTEKLSSDEEERLFANTLDNSSESEAENDYDSSDSGQLGEDEEEENDDEDDERSDEEESTDDGGHENVEDDDEEIDTDEQEDEIDTETSSDTDVNIKKKQVGTIKKVKQLKKPSKVNDKTESSDDEINDEVKKEKKLKAKKTVNKDSTTTTNKQRKQKKADSNIQEISLTKMDKKPDEYENHDTSDEEDIRNTVGNIPMEWYKDYPHLGYDWDGKKILKPNTGDELDNFLKKIEDPEFWRTVKDPQTGQDVVLTDEDIELIKRIKSQKIPDVSFDEYAPWIEWFTSEVLKTPVRKFPEHKRSFTPSKIEEKKVSRIVRGLKMGWIKTREEAAKLREKKEPQFYMLWETDDQAEEMRRIHKHIPAPKRPLPGHAESYNPPAEYLFNKKEMKEWIRQKDTPSKRKLHFVPQKYKSLREVPAYERYTRERFLRCLDLYLCPRAIKMRLNIEPEALVPKLPSPKDLQPFPTTLSIEYIGHKDMVRTISCDTRGQYLVSGSDDCTVKIWEVNTGRCLRTVEFDSVIHKVSWCPNPALSLIGVASGQTIHLINPLVGDNLVVKKTDTVLSEPPAQDVIVPERISSTVRWEQAVEENWHKKGIRISLHHFKPVTQINWHGRGDYFATVMPDGLNRSVLINQLSRRRSQLPFNKSKGLVQCVMFHPIRPFLFVATQRHVRIYDLVKQELLKKLMSNSKWISSIAIHPGGDNILVGTYDRKMLWFDLDLSTKPYQTLRLHGTAVRSVAYHKRYPLFASGSDDRSVIVSHGMVYNDLLQNPLIVPLKRLCDHKQTNDFGVFDVMFHPIQPWIFSSGADGTVKLYS